MAAGRVTVLNVMSLHLLNTKRVCFIQGLSSYRAVNILHLVFFLFTTDARVIVLKTILKFTVK